MRIAATADSPSATVAAVSGQKLAKLRVGRAAGLGIMSDMERIRASVEGAAVSMKGGQVIAFASAHAGEGKTTALAEFSKHLVRARGRSVLVVDATGTAALGHALGVAKPGSLADVEAMMQARLPLEPGSLHVARLTEPLHSEAVPSHDRDTIERLRQAFDYVLVEFPSFAQSTDILLNARLFTGIVIIIEAGRTRWQVVQNLSENLTAHGGRILGVILNRRHYYIPGWIYRWL